jgi:hypothetical protein
MIPRRPDVIFYRGKPCRNCGGTLRYRKTRGCVDCARATAMLRYFDARDARREARCTDVDIEIDCDAA